MISLSEISVHQGTFSLQDIAIEVPTGAYGVLMGKTGSGKTTLLEAICGLRRVAAGSVRLMGRDVTRLKPAARNIGYVPQDVAFSPRSPYENTWRSHWSYGDGAARPSRSVSTHWPNCWGSGNCWTVDPEGSAVARRGA